MSGPVRSRSRESRRACGGGPGAEQMGFGAAWPGWIRRSSTRRWRGGPPQRLKRLVTDTSTLVSGFGWAGHWPGCRRCTERSGGPGDAGLLDVGDMLVSTSNGGDATARILPDGRIEYDGDRFEPRPPPRRERRTVRRKRLAVLVRRYSQWSSSVGRAARSTSRKRYVVAHPAGKIRIRLSVAATSQTCDLPWSPLTG